MKVTVNTCALKSRWMAALAPLLFACAASAQSVSFDYSSLGTSNILFQGTGGLVNFTPDTSGFDFQIADASLPGLDGLTGNIEGTFTIGSVTILAPGVEEAALTGTGTLTISDGANHTLSADISSSGDNALTVGTTGALNPDGFSNLSNFTYAGSNTALKTLAESTSGSDTVSFQFLPAQTLAQLGFGGELHSTTFSGSIAAIPEPSAYVAILGAAAIGIAVIRRRMGLT